MLILLLPSLQVINWIFQSSLSPYQPNLWKCGKPALTAELVMLVAPTAIVLVLWECLTVWHSGALTSQTLSCCMYHGVLFEPCTCLWAEWGPRSVGGQKPWLSIEITIFLTLSGQGKHQDLLIRKSYSYNWKDHTNSEAVPSPHPDISLIMVGDKEQPQCWGLLRMVYFKWCIATQDVVPTCS